MDRDMKVGILLNRHCEMLGKLKYTTQNLTNVKENQKQNKLLWNIEGRMSLTDLRRRIKVG